MLHVPHYMLDAPHYMLHAWSGLAQVYYILHALCETTLFNLYLYPTSIQPAPLADGCRRKSSRCLLDAMHSHKATRLHALSQGARVHGLEVVVVEVVVNHDVHGLKVGWTRGCMQ